MRALYQKIEYQSRGEWFTIIPLGCIHLGNYLSDEALLASVVQEIADDPNCYWGGMGDMFEAITRHDPRFRSQHMAKWLVGKPDLIDAAMVRLQGYFDPIKDKCLWYAKGNHERTLLIHDERDVYGPMCRFISPDDKGKGIALGLSGFIPVRFDRQGGGGRTITIYAHHGYGGGSTVGGRAGKLEKLPATFEADIYLMAHAHLKLQFQSMRYRVSRGNVREIDTRLAYTGGFLKSLGERGSYVEDAGYPPRPTGVIRIRIHPDSGAVEITM